VKATTNSNRKTYLNYQEFCDIDELVLVIFSQTYELRETYRAPWSEVYKKVRFNKPGNEVYWKDLNEFKLDLNSLPNQNVLKLFR